MPFARITDKERKKTLISKVRNEREHITRNVTKIQKFIMKSEKLKEIYIFGFLRFPKDNSIGSRPPITSDNLKW